MVARIFKYRFLPVILFAGFMLNACKKDIPGVTPSYQYAGTDFSQVFEAFWTGMNNNYVFWGIDTTNWDNMHRIYQPVFARLQMSNPQDVLNSVQYFRQMTRGLVDGHYNLSFINSADSDSVVNPAAARKINIAPALPFTFFSKVITGKYFNNSYWADSSFTVNIDNKTQTEHMGLVTGVIDQHILYLHLNTFFLIYTIQKNYGTILNGWNMFLANLHNPDLATEGIIIDLRSNNGGEIEDLNFIAGQMITRPLLFGYTREKSGNGRLDYTPWADAIVTPQAGSVSVNAPIIVLTDQHSISMAELTTMALKTLPGTYIIGDTTWGANGPLDTNDNLYGGGQFSFANFGYVFTSSAMTKYIDGKIYEGKGFPPDEYVPYNKDSVAAGVDLQLQAAIKYFKH